MSRVGRRPVDLPSGVKGEVSGGEVRIAGPKGKLSMKIPVGAKVLQEGNQMKVEIDNSIRLPMRDLASRHGLTRSLIGSMVEGVVNGFEKTLEVTGAGYRPQVQGNKFSITIGFSQPVTIDLPDGVKATAARVETGTRGDERHRIVISGCDKAEVGEVAARIRRIRKADVYKGKGIRYAGEVVRRKAGKSSVTSGGGK